MEVVLMAEVKKHISLTDDPLTNMHLMIPLLDEKAREAISYVMFGYILRDEQANKEAKQT